MMSCCDREKVRQDATKTAAELSDSTVHGEFAELCESGADGVSRMAPSQLTDKPVSWQDSRSWSSHVQDHGGQGRMPVLNRSVRISVCNFVKLCFFYHCVRNCHGQQASGRDETQGSKFAFANGHPTRDIVFNTRDSTCILLIESYVVKLHNAKKNLNYNNGWDNYVFTICWFMQPCPSFGNSFSR